MKLAAVLVGAVLILGVLAAPAFGCGCPPPPECQPIVGVGTPGYWLNHPEDWPVTCLQMAGGWYTQDQILEILEGGTKGDKSLTLFAAQVATKLNIYAGAQCNCIWTSMTLADAWLAANPVGSCVDASSAEWKCGEPLYWDLDCYNNGFLCAPSRDTLY